MAVSQPCIGTHGRNSNGEKYALIIGNANYIQRPLVNPTNDARVIGHLLRQAGFEVHLLLDARTTQMRDAVAQFQKRTSSSDIAKTVLFYYAGHGMQLQWRNFLIGVDAKISRPEDVPVHSLDVAEIFGRTETPQAKQEGASWS